MAITKVPTFVDIPQYGDLSIQFVWDDNNNQLKHSMNSGLSWEVMYSASQVRQLRKKGKLRIEELEKAIHAFFDSDDLWVDGIQARYAAIVLQRLVNRVDKDGLTY